MANLNSKSASKFSYNYPLIYYYRRTSKNDDLQIKYSIRSACKNLNATKVIILGTKPEWFVETENSIHIPTVSGVTSRMWTIGWVPFQHFSSALEQLEELGIDNFLLMNDDFFIMHPVYNWEDLERSGKSYMEKTYHCRPYHIKTIKTFKIVDTRCYFNLHAPMRMRMPYVKILCKFWSLLNDKDLDFRTFYGNLFIHDYPQRKVVDDHKILDDQLDPSITFISTSANGFQENKKVYQAILNTFTEQSFCEKPIISKL